MGKDLAKRYSEDFYRLYQEGKKVKISNSVLAFLLLSAIEEISKYFIETLISKCGDSTLGKIIRCRIYNEMN
jgi:hypothetical protein